MDLSPEVYMMSRDEMSSTSSSPEYHRVVCRLRGVLHACMYMSMMQVATAIAPYHGCIPKTEVIPKEYEWFTELYSMKTEVTMMISPDP